MLQFDQYNERMDGTSPKGEHQFNIPSSARSLLKNEYSEVFEALTEHCAFLDKRASTLSSQLKSLEDLLQEEQEKRYALESELAAYKKQQQQTDEVQSQFLDTMSHELRTPLNGILGMAQLMLDMPLSSELKDYTEAIMDSGKLLNGIIGSLLDFSRLSEDNFALEPKTFNVLSCLEELTTNHALTAINKGIGLSLLPNRNIHSDITLDQDRFKQIIHAVIDNAIKFTDEGRVSIKARIEPINQEQSPAHLIIQIQDTGCGIAPEHRIAVFKPFWQADQSNARKHGGIGMGLALSRKLLSFMGGEIIIDSRVGQGTLCTIQFPLDVPVKPLEVEPVKYKTPLNVGFFKIQEADQLVLKEYLGWLGIQATDIQATDSNTLDEASTTLAPPDLVITSHNDASPHELNELRHVLARSNASPLFACLVSPGSELKPAMKRLFDVLIPYPILYPSLKGALNFAAETLNSQKSPKKPASRHETSNDISTKVLLIEPNKINQKILTHMLESLGLEVEVIDSISPASQPGESAVYSTILINTMFEPAPALEALRELVGKLSLTDNHKLIGIQGKNTGKPAQVYAEAGVSAFLTLPTSIDQVRALIFDT